MNTLFWVLPVVAALWILHRLALRAEERGWIYYLRRKASPGTAGRAFLQVQSLLEPGVQHVARSSAEALAEDDDAGDPPGSEVPSRRPLRTS